MQPGSPSSQLDICSAALCHSGGVFGEDCSESAAGQIDKEPAVPRSAQNQTTHSSCFGRVHQSKFWKS